MLPSNKTIDKCYYAASACEGGDRIRNSRLDIQESKEKIFCFHLRRNYLSTYTMTLVL